MLKFFPTIIRFLKEANKAVKKSQEIAAERMRDVMGDMGLNLPGMGGGQA